MRYFIVILLAISMIALPLKQLRPAEDCCSPAEGSVEIVADGADWMDMGEDCCCFAPESDDFGQPSLPDHDDDSEQSPCDDGNCPSSCCAGMAQTMLALSGSVCYIESSTNTDVLNVQPQLALPQPHLQRLKRPPRVV